MVRSLSIMAASLDEEAAALFNRERLEDPFPIWNRLREEAPVFFGNGMVIVTRYDDVRTLLPNEKYFSVHMGGSRPEAVVAGWSEENQQMFLEMTTSDESVTGLGEDEADHKRLRGIMHRFFTPRRIQRMEEEIQRFWDEIVDDAAQQDLSDQKLLSQRLALKVITDLVGCPEVDGPYIVGLVEREAHILGTTDEELVRDAYEARKQFNEYLDRTVIAAYRERPDSNDFVRAVMDAEGEDNMSAPELRGMVRTLLFGGTETTSVLLSTGLLELLEHREQWEWLCEDPVARVPDAVEELLRYVSPSQLVAPRTALADVMVAGVEVPEGQTVIGSLAAANRDPAQYENPDTLDISQRARPHLGLGLGPHFCLGASVARAEARIAFTTLAQRYPNLELAVSRADLDWSGAPMVVRSMRELPIRLGPQAQPAAASPQRAA